MFFHVKLVLLLLHLMRLIEVHIPWRLRAGRIPRYYSDCGYPIRYYTVFTWLVWLGPFEILVLAPVAKVSFHVYCQTSSSIFLKYDVGTLLILFGILNLHETANWESSYIWYPSGRHQLIKTRKRCYEASVAALELLYGIYRDSICSRCLSNISLVSYCKIK